MSDNTATVTALIEDSKANLRFHLEEAKKKIAILESAVSIADENDVAYPNLRSELLSAKELVTSITDLRDLF